MKIQVWFIVAVLLGSRSLSAAPMLQSLIDNTPSGGILALSPGRYEGSVVIDKPLTMESTQGQVIIDGGGTGSVITIKADGVTLRNLHITNSGDSHDHINAGISVFSSNNKLLYNTIDHTLFGIELREAHNNLVEGNDISSKPSELGARGDSIKVWASHNNTFQKNKLHDSRDMVIWYSNNSVIQDNEAWNNRYSLHFMYTDTNTIRNNRYSNNAVGIFLMYSKNSLLEENEILASQGATGMGMGMKEVDNMTLLNNRIIYCTMGLYLDQSPSDPLNYNLIFGNQIAYNLQGIVFHSTLKNNVFKGNALVDNIEGVIVHANGTAIKNIWEGNYWSDYEGFDRNRNGYGDRDYVNYVYLDQLWMNDPWIRFYFASPVISMLNFLAKLAPFSEPRLLVRDSMPVLSLNNAFLRSKANLHFEIPEIDEDEDEDLY
ncbi:nitrous oxide reductase family maturation protein NosD [Deltaproteobacteria bacterium TL4]